MNISPSTWKLNPDKKIRQRNNSLTYLFTYLLTPWSRVLLQKLTGFQLVKKFPALYGTRTFITAVTSARHLSLSWASSIQSIPPHPTFWRPILILSSYLCLGLQSGLFPSAFPTKTLYTPLHSPIRATCPAHLILLDVITRTILGEEYRSFSSSLRSFLHSPVISSIVGPNILLSKQLTQQTISSVVHIVPLWQNKEQGTVPSLFDMSESVVCLLARHTKWQNIH